MNTDDMPRHPDRDLVKTLLDQALELQESGRREFVVEAAGEDERLRDELLGLLDALGSHPTLLSAATREGAGQPAAERPTEGVGTTIDRYKLLQEIGEGGFGTVWMAAQQEPVRRKVALKVIKLGMDTKQVIARFEAERQALAMMDHPNIAKVLDGGMTPSGRPFFVMELVKGIPITHYCDKAGLTTTERLELFQQVCHAVQHAHQKGIIHRDLKPGNILVTQHDGEPVPKVIDFGIAKATAAELTQRTVFTNFNQMIGTPEYMAPEQTELSGLDIDTRADVYSLGVLLYELLTGTKPFDHQKLMQQGYLEMMRVIREEEPPKPSTRISTLGDDLSVAARLRHTTPKSLSRLMRGDLDWIVMRALDKVRDRRYATANELAADIGRHLLDEPVHAGPPSRRYRLRKYIVRHRIGVTAGVAVGLAIVVGLGAAAWGFFEARDQRDRALKAEGEAVGQRDAANAARDLAEDEKVRADKEREHAQVEEKKAKTVTDLLQEMLSGSDPHLAKGKDYTVRQLLEDFDRGYQGELAGQPEVEASIRGVVGRSYLGLGLVDKAAAYLEPALARVRQLHGPESLEYAASLESRGFLQHSRGAFAAALEDLESAREIHAAADQVSSVIAEIDMWRADMCWHLGKYEDAERLAELALAALEAAGRAAEPVFAQCLGILAKSLGGQGRYRAEEEALQRVLALKKQRYGPRHPEVAGTLAQLGMHHMRRSEFATADRLTADALEMVTEAYGNSHPDIAYLLARRGRVLESVGKLAEAEKVLRQSVEMRRRYTGDEDPENAVTQLDLAKVVLARGGVAEAERLCEAALSVLQKAYPGPHGMVALALSRLAAVYQRKGNLRKAKRDLLRAVEIQKELFDEQHPMALAVQRGLADVYQARKEYTKAVPIYERLVVAYERQGNKQSLASTLSGLGGCLLVTKDLEAATRHLRRSLDLIRGVAPAGHPDLLIAISNLALALQMQARFAEAEPYNREAADIARSRPDDVRSLVSALMVLADLLIRQEKWVEAESVLRETEAAVSGKPGSSPFESEALKDLAIVLSKQKGKLEAAESVARKALQRSLEMNQEVHPSTRKCLNVLAGILRERGKHDEVMPLYERGIAIVRKALPPQHPARATQLATVGSYLLQQGQFAKAEPLLRECLEIREAGLKGTWLHYNAMSLLGGALLGLGEHAAAEPLLLDGYNKMVDVPERVAFRKIEALDRVHKLYVSWGKEDKAAEWQKKLEAAKAASKQSATTEKK